MNLENDKLTEAQESDLKKLKSSKLESAIEVTSIKIFTAPENQGPLDSTGMSENSWRDIAQELSLLLVEMTDQLEESLLSREAMVCDSTDRYHEHEGEATALLLSHLRGLAMKNLQDPEAFAHAVRTVNGMWDYIHNQYRAK